MPPSAAPQGLTRAGLAFGLLHALSWLAALAQIFIDHSYDNLVATALVLLSATATFGYVRATRAIPEVPLSTFALLGLCVTTQWGALVAQSLLADSLTANLRVPLQTFGYLLGFQLVAIAAHWITRRLKALVSVRQAASELLLSPLGIFQVPAPAALWAMGIIGLLSMVVGKGLQIGLLGKVADGFGFLAWAPFCIPLLFMRHGNAYCHLRRHVPFIAIFALAFVLLGLALNARAVMMGGVLTAALLSMLLLLVDERPFTLRQLRYPAIILILGALLYEPLSYFFTAVQAARDQRDKISKIEMIEHTWHVLQDPAAVRRERERSLIDADVGLYDEIYFKSSMVGRLIETKFHDNAFFMVEGVSPLESRLIAEDAVDRIVSILPFPVLKAMDMERAKFVTLYSAGDLLSNLRLGLELGGFRTGSMFAQGIAIFGAWTPVAYFLLCIPLFMFWDLLSRPAAAGLPAVVSVLGLLLIYRLFAYGIVSESISGLTGVLLRFQLQTILIFALVFALTRAVWPPFKPGADATAANDNRRSSVGPGVGQGAT